MCGWLRCWHVAGGRSGNECFEVGELLLRVPGHLFDLGLELLLVVLVCGLLFLVKLCKLALRLLLESVDLSLEVFGGVFLA